MASVSGSSRRTGSRRRTISEINMVPFIDVMLVLLIIFMVSAPLITTGVVDLPSVGASRQRPERVIEVVVGADEALQLKIDGQADLLLEDGGADRSGAGTAQQRRQQQQQQHTLDALVARVREAQGDDASIPVVISADRGVRYESVLKVMDGPAARRRAAGRAVGEVERGVTGR